MSNFLYSPAIRATQCDDPLERATRIEQQAREFDAHFAKVSWQVRQLARLLPLFQSGRIRHGSRIWLRGYLHDYRLANRRAGSDEIDVAQPVDSAIPFDRSALPDYLSVITIWIAGINILHSNFKSRVIPDIEDAIDRVATFYPEAAEIFNGAQTTFSRGEDGGVAFKLLRFIDKSRNAAPSLHVEAAAFGYSCLSDIIERQAMAAGDDANTFKPVTDVLFRKTVRIMEAVLLVKQHVIRDVALGLGLLTGKSETLLPQKRGHLLIEAMFESDRHGMDNSTVQAIREGIRTIYDEVVLEIAGAATAPSAVAISHLRRLKVKNQA